MRDLPKLVSVSETNVVVQQMIVNGEAQNVTAKAFAITCPSCGRVIYQFDPNIPRMICIAQTAKNREDLTKHFRYCPECGQKLSYEFDFIEGEVVNERETRL